MARGAGLPGPGGEPTPRGDASLCRGAGDRARVAPDPTALDDAPAASGRLPRVPARLSHARAHVCTRTDAGPSRALWNCGVLRDAGFWAAQAHRPPWETVPSPGRVVTVQMRSPSSLHTEVKTGGSGFRPEVNPESRWESGGHVFLEVRVLGSPRPGCRGRVSDGEALAAAGRPVWGRRARGVLACHVGR